jgi:hypothetical protein
MNTIPTGSGSGTTTLVTKDKKYLWEIPLVISIIIMSGAI